MNFTDQLKEGLEKGNPSIKAKGEMFGTKWGALSITDFTGSPVDLGASLHNLKFRFQSIASGAVLEEGSYRLDNCHGYLHQHSSGAISQLDIHTLSGALSHILGSNFERLKC
ncbi:MAG: hypothetical protein ABIA78_02865 [archaeon]